MLPTFKTLLAAMTLATAVSFGAMASDLNTVSVQGQGEIKVDPDTAVLSIGVKSQAKTVQQAQTSNAQTVANVKAALTTFRLGKQDVKTVGYSVSPSYDYPANSKPVVTGYEVQYSLQVRVTDLNQVGPMIDAAGKAGANDIGNISYTSSKAAQLKLEALKLAVQDARNQADAIAAAASRSVKQPLHITSQNTHYAPIVASAQRSAPGGGAPAPAPTDIEGGQITISASVSAEFEF